MEPFWRVLGTAWNGFWFLVGSVLVIAGVVLTIGSLIGGYDHEWYVGPIGILFGAWVGGYFRIYNALKTTRPPTQREMEPRTGFETSGTPPSTGRVSADTVKADLRQRHPEAWAAGEAAGLEALQTRSDDLASMLIQGPEERVKQYQRAMTEEVMRTISSGDYQAPFWPVTQQGILAFGIAMGVRIRDVLEAERREGRRIISEVE